MNNSERREIELFNAAVAMSDRAAREVFLAEACSGDAALRRKLDALLKVQADADGYFGTIALPQTFAATEQAGEIVARYKLLEKIGEGGFGTVWVAEQREPVKRRVALKIIKLGMDTREVVARFEAERQALAMMDHPNIAKVFDAGATESGRPYFVMELVRGIRITDYCDQNNLSTMDRLKLFIQVCQAIQHAHQKGIIHRDIKPSNILVTLHDGVPVPKVIDFGIAKATHAELTEKTIYTQFQQFIGTPAYMSPEQAEMSGLDIDTRSDIYSLGVLLYELLVGATPFDGRELLESGLDEMRRIIREKEPLRPSTKLETLQAGALTETAKHRAADPPRLASLLRGDLDWVAMKCLEKDRTRRYETASALALDLQRHLAHEPVTARPPSASYRFQKLIHRHKLAVGAAVAIALVLVLGIIASSWQAIRATRAEREQTRLRGLAEIEAARSEQVARFMKEMLSGVGPKVALGRDTQLLREILDRTSERVRTELLPRQPEVAADLFATLGTVYFELGDLTTSESMHGEALALRRKLFGEEHLLVAQSLADLAGVYLRQGKFAEAEKAFLEALAQRRKSGNEESIARSLTSLGWVYMNQGKYAEGEAHEREAIAIQKRRLGPEHPNLAYPLNLLGTMLMNQKKHAEAEEIFRETLALRRKALPPEHPDIAQTLDTLGQTLMTRGKLAEAETNLIEALAIRKKVLGPRHEHVATSLYMLALLHDRRKNFTNAESTYRESIDVYRHNKSSTYGFAGALNHLGKLLMEQGRLDEAEPVLREAVALSEKLGAAYGVRATGQKHLGELLRLRKQFAQAEPRLLASFQDSGDDRRLKRQLMDSLVQLYTDWGKPGPAAEWQRKRADFE